jgi:acyl-CoA thioesterase-1
MSLRLFFLSLVLSGFSGAEATGAARSEAAKNDESLKTLRFVIIGDSLVEGYGVSREQAFPALLEPKMQSIDPRWRVINAGISGSTSGSALGRVRWHLKEPPALLMLVLGANDGLRGLSIKAMKENLKKAILAAQEKKVPVVLAGMQMPPNYSQEYRSEFAKAFSELGKLPGVTLIPFILDGVAGEKDLNLADGIHPNEKGQAKVAENVFKTIETLVQKVSRSTQSEDNSKNAN